MNGAEGFAGGPTPVEPGARGVSYLTAPPCERHFIIHYHAGEPYGLLIDGQPYRVKRLRRSTGLRNGDYLLRVVTRLAPSTPNMDGGS